MKAVDIVDCRGAQAADDLVQSFRQTGFAVLTKTDVSADLIDETYAEWKVFFEGWSEAQKRDFLFTREEQAGYFPFQSEKAKQAKIGDLKSFFHFYPWANRHPHHLSATPRLFSELEELAKQILAWVEEKTPSEIARSFSRPLRQMLSGSRRTLFRIIYYPALTEALPEGAVRAAEHEDINLLTLLPAATAEGLEVKDVQGEWHRVPCSDRGSIVVNVGDMLQLASQGYYPSTTHRVVNPEGAKQQIPRYSMPLFLHPADEVVLSPQKTAKIYLEERLREIGLL